MNIIAKWASKFQHPNAHHSISKVTPIVYTNTQDISTSVNNFYVPTPKEVDTYKELVEISSPYKHITSPFLSKSKAFVAANPVVMKKFKLIDQVGEKKNGGNSDQDGIGDVVVEHIEDEFEE